MPEGLGALDAGDDQRGLVERGDDEQDEVGAVRRAPPTAGSCVTMKSLRSTGMSTAARTASRSSRLPPKRRCSVSTLITLAPPAS